MAIKVTRNDAGNCITFVGSTNPVYWNSCLEGEINENNSNNVNVINKIRTVEEGTTIYEFFNLPYTDFQDKDGNDFVSPSDCAEYITANANVLSNTGTFIFSQTDVIDAQRDATDTTVLFSNGDIFAVNSLTASAVADGTIKISTVRGGKDIYTHIRYYNVSVLNGGVTGFNTIEAAVDRLNEVLGGTTVGSNTGNTSTTVTTTSNSSDFTVYGSRITETGSGTTLGYTSTAQAGNFDTSNGLYSNQTISKNGEYFEFEQASGDWTNSRGVYIGLFDETTYNVEDLNVDSAGNAVKGLLYLRLYPTPFTFADATNGAGKINEVGFSNSPQTKTKFRLGRDNDGRVYIAHETSPNVFEVICRSESVIATDTELRFFSIMPRDNQLNGIRNMTVNNAVLAASFIWYYIESPDTEFYYPLFSSQADAKTVDELYGTAASGSGLSHPHTFADEQPSVQTWYMPASYMTHAGASAPTTPIGIAWNEIQTGDDASYIPSQFSQSITVVEGDNINLQIKPSGDANTYALSNVPTGLAYNSISGYLQGTAPEVTGDNVANPSDLYNITVTIANSYGSSVGTLALTITNEDAPVSSSTTAWTKAIDFNGSSQRLKQYAATQASALKMNATTTSVAATGRTTSDNSGRAWTTTVVFNLDGNNSDQYIWNYGEGNSNGDNNIYLRINGSRELFFGWGQESTSLNECRLGTFSANKWYGIYIAHDGSRLESSYMTPYYLSRMFTIKHMSETRDFNTLYDDRSTTENWTAGTTGGIMTNSISGDLTIGGRGSNDNFHGKIASMVVNTLKVNQILPDDVEIAMMINDPMKWLADYKVGNAFKYPWSSVIESSWSFNHTYSAWSTQVWLMGEGTSDSFANNIRNQSSPADLTTRMVFNSMQANDIETVNITGLTS